MIDYKYILWEKLRKDRGLRTCNFDSDMIRNQPTKKLRLFLVFANHPDVHRGELAGGGSMAVTVGVSDL